MFYKSFFRDLDQIQRDFYRVDEEANFPRVNIYTKDDEALVVAEVAGILSENIDVTLKDNVLTISGKRISPELPDDIKENRLEIPVGDFSRSLKLSFEIDADKISATAKNGILSVNLPFAESAKPKKIAINK